MSSFLFDLDGRVIAFQRSWDDRHVFGTDGRCIGWRPDDGNDVVDRGGHHLGTIVADRLVRRNDAAPRPLPVTVPDAGWATPTGRPGTALPFEHRYAYEDVGLLPTMAGITGAAAGAPLMGFSTGR